MRSRSSIYSKSDRPCERARNGWRSNSGSTRPQPLISMGHHENHAAFSYAASPFNHSDKPVIVTVLDGFGDDGAISLYVAERGRLQRLRLNDSLSDSLGCFYSVLSSTQGGWTVLSSEGRYMGAVAWGDYDRLTNPYYRRLRQIFYFGEEGQVRVNRALANWHMGGERDSTGAASRHDRRPDPPEKCGTPMRCCASRDATRRRDPRASRSGGGDATGFRGRAFSRRRPSDSVDRQRPAGVDRRDGPQLPGQHAPSRSLQRRLVSPQFGEADSAAHRGPADAGRRGGRDGGRIQFRLPAGARPGPSMKHAFWWGGVPPQKSHASRDAEVEYHARQRQ